MKRRRVFLALASLATCLAPALNSFAGPVRLNDLNTNGTDARVSHDSRWAVFFSGYPREAFRVPVEGGEVQQLNPPLPPGHYVRSIQFVPGVNELVYLTRIYQDTWSGIYRIPLEGGAAVPLSPESAPVYSFEISSTGRHVLYQVAGASLGALDTYVVPTTGGNPVHIEGHSIGFTPDGRYVLHANSDFSPTTLLRTSPDGGPSLRLSVDLGPATVVAHYSAQATPDSRYVIYTASGVPLKPGDLYSVPIDGGPSVQLNDPSVTPFSLTFTTPDSQRVVFQGYNTPDKATDFYSVPIAGGASVRLTPDLPSGHYLDNLPVISPDSRQLLYRVNRADETCDFGGAVETSELHIVSLDGGQSTLLSQSIDASAESRTILGPQFTADLSRVLYLDGLLYCESWGQFDLLSVPADGGTPIRLSLERQNGFQGVKGYELSPDGLWAVFIQQPDPDIRADVIFAVSPHGGEPIPLSVPAPLGSEIRSDTLVFSPDGRYLIFEQLDWYQQEPGQIRGRTNLYSVKMPAVPEPSSGLLLFITAIALVLRQRFLSGELMRR